MIFQAMLTRGASVSFLRLFVESILIANPVSIGIRHSTERILDHGLPGEFSKHLIQFGAGIALFTSR